MLKNFQGHPRVSKNLSSGKVSVRRVLMANNKSPVKKKARKKRRKKTKYHTGVHTSPKCSTPINYRSGWEYTICLFLDADPDVVCYGYEVVVIPYVSNKRTQRVRNYLPDFLVFYKNGKRKLIEVKRLNQMLDVVVQKKAEAARLWCSRQTPIITYEFWTDKVVLPLKKIYG